MNPLEAHTKLLLVLVIPLALTPTQLRCQERSIEPTILEHSDGNDCTESEHLLSLAREARRQNSTFEAIRYAQSVHLNRDCPFAFVQAKNIHATILIFDLKKYDDGINVCQDGLRIDPSQSNLLFIKAQAHYELGQYEYAIIDLRKITKSYPLGIPPTWDWIYLVYRLMALSEEKLGHSTRNADRLRKALEWWKKALEIAEVKESRIDPSEAKEQIGELEDLLKSP